MMSQNAFAAGFLKRVWPFWDIMHQRVNIDGKLTFDQRVKNLFEMQMQYWKC